MTVAAKKRVEEAPEAVDENALIPFTFRIERGIVAGLDEMVADLRQEHPAYRGLTRSDIIRGALREAIEKHRAEKVPANK